MGDLISIVSVDQRLQAVQEVCGALCVGGGGEDRAAVIAQDFQPTADIRGVIFAIVECDP